MNTQDLLTKVSEKNPRAVALVAFYENQTEVFVSPNMPLGEILMAAKMVDRVGDTMLNGVAASLKPKSAIERLR